MSLNTPITNCNGEFSWQTGPNGSIIRDPFTGNIVPQSRWDPVAKTKVRPTQGAQKVQNSSLDEAAS